MNIKLSKIASLLSLDLIGADTNIHNLTIDSREVKKGDFFVAIEGKKYDGHDFIQESIDNGASAILCNESFKTSEIKLLSSNKLLFIISYIFSIFIAF